VLTDLVFTTRFGDGRPGTTTRNGFEQELAALELVAQGLTNRQIGTKCPRTSMWVTMGRAAAAGRAADGLSGGGVAVGVALLESKYRVPGRRPNAVARPRLDERLNSALCSRLTVLSAPAGFGKTTVLTEWLATFGPGAPAVAWLSLDERDNDAALFWRYVVTAIGRAVEDVGGAALGLLDSSPAATEAALAALLNDLGGLKRDLVLVVDDYHLVEAADVHEGMTFLLEHQPPQLHVVLATRTDPPLPLARMRARGQLSEVRAVDLRFTVEESAAYLNDGMGFRLSEGDVMSLDGRTEGWIAALQLAALSMQGRSDVSAFIAGFAGDDRYVLDYLGEEVLARQPSDVRQFLLQTSILERLTGPLCDAVTGRPGGKAPLVALERANMFVVPLDDKRQWYRYHHLFADVLRAHLHDEQPEHLAELHARASVWFEAAGDSSQAVSHALAGGDSDRAADLMELAVRTMLRDRREAELVGWVRLLPDDVVRKRPVLGIGFVAALAQVSNFDTVGQRLSDVERSVRAEGGSWPPQPPPDLIVVDRVAYRSLPAQIHLYRAALDLAGGDLEGTVRQAREAMSLAPPDDALTRASASALQGLASLTAGDLSRAHAAYTRTVAELTSVGFLADVLGCCITLGDIRRAQGQLDDALRTYQRALDLAPPQAGADPLRGTADMHVGIAGVLLERDDLAAAGEHLDVARRLGDHIGLPQNPYRWRVAMARLREAHGALDEALELLDEAARVYNGDYNPNVRPVPAIRARLRLRRGELVEAEAWARERHLSPDDELSYLHEYEHVTLARLLLARHHAEREARALGDALELLRRLLAAAQDGGRGGSVLEVLILQALAHRARGDVPAALARLERAVMLAQPEGYVRLFADEGPPMAALLKALIRQSTSPGYARRLLAATTRSEHHDLSRRGALVEPLSDRELDVLRLLGTDLDGPDIARALSVSLSTVRTHTRNIYAKLGVTSRRAAVRQAHDLNLLPGPRRG
jgi:LuxR family transcriptional regulator, maltose regulon positive regulatory protein